MVDDEMKSKGAKNMTQSQNFERASNVANEKNKLNEI